jgi:hypothetical protein
MSRTPAHAGRLRPSEQCVFALVFALMATFVVVVTMSAARSSQFPQLGGPTTAAGSRTVPAGTGGAVRPEDRPDRAGTPIQPVTARLNKLLAAALGPVVTAHPGQLAVGVIDATTGQEALYHANQPFSSASIVTADILAALLVRHERAGPLMTSEQAVLATAMMTNGSHAAAASLWRAVGAGNGLVSADHLLKLSHTVPGSGGQWNLTRTTAADQLQLLTDLTSAHSPLTAAARDDVLRLMSSDATLPRWGVSAVATERAGNAVLGGWLANGKLWLANSIGIVWHAGDLLLVAVLSSNSSSQAAGISLASAAAVAAAKALTTNRH